MKIVKGKKPTPRRTLLYGVHGVGKSTWAAQAPDCLILNLEDGLNDIDCQRTELLSTTDGVLDALRWLAESKHSFRYVAIDSLDWLEGVIHAEVAKAAGKKSIGEIGYGAGYKTALATWDRIIFALDWLRREKNIGVIALAHCAIKRFESPEHDSYDRYQPALHDSASALWQEWCDEVLFAAYRVYTRKEDQGFNKERQIAVGGNERYIRTQESAGVLAKNRLSLPEELAFEWSAYAEHFPQPESGNISGVVVNGTSKKELVTNG
jgi:hypothetical protein